MLQMMTKVGIRSDYLFAAGFASIGLTVLSWAASLKGEDAGTDRADRWGIFIGEWAPTFFILGTAMRLEEQRVAAEDEVESTPLMTAAG